MLFKYYIFIVLIQREQLPAATPYLSLLTVSGLGSFDELKRLHLSGQDTSSGRTTAVRMGGVTRFRGSGQNVSWGVFSSPVFTGVCSSDNLMRFVLISNVGRSAGETSDKIFYKAMKIEATKFQTRLQFLLLA